MARIAWPSTLTAAVPRPLGWMRVLMPVLLVAGCAPWDRPLPIPKEVTQAGAAARVVVPRDLNVNPSESVVEPGTPAVEPAPSQGSGPERTTFALPDAIAFALRKSPRLRSARAAIERARGQEQVAFAPFLPQIDLLGQYGVVSDTLAPGKAGYAGFLLASGSGTRSYAQTEIGLQWTLYDFGRTGGRYHQAVARGHIAELQLLRAEQTVEFDVATAYLEVLLARAFHRVHADAGRRAEATLDDTVARSTGGVALREDVLRAQVQLSESREALVVAREAEFDALARLNNVMGRNAAWPLEVIDLDVRPPLRGALATLLERAAAETPRVDVARTAFVQAEENLRLIRVRYHNGNAAPTDIVDSEAALTRSQQRFFSATYTYLAALARLDYAVGQRQGGPSSEMK